MQRELLLKSFFFSSRRRHTRYWRDWSSDVCSSDLVEGAEDAADPDPPGRVACPVGDPALRKEHRYEQRGRADDEGDERRADRPADPGGELRVDPELDRKQRAREQRENEVAPDCHRRAFK